MISSLRRPRIEREREKANRVIREFREGNRKSKSLYSTACCLNSSYYLVTMLVLMFWVLFMHKYRKLGFINFRAAPWMLMQHN